MGILTTSYVRECYLSKYFIATLHTGLWECSGAVGGGAGENPLSVMMIRLALVISAAIVVWNVLLSSTVSSYLDVGSSLINIPRFLSPVGITNTTKQNRRRVFLGIFTKPALDARLRNAIRKTYLREHQQPLKICSIAEMRDHEDNDDCDCDVVYAFFNHRPSGTVPNQSKAARRRGGNQEEEKDMIYLDEDNINPLWSMYRYLVHSNMLRGKNNTTAFQPPHEINRQTTTIQFDFVAYTSTNYVLCPDRVWPQELFHGNSIPMFLHPGLCMVPAGGRSVGSTTGWSID